MIYFEIIGGSKSEKQLVENAFWFALKELMPRKKNLDVLFSLVKMEGTQAFQVMIEKTFHEIELKKGMSKDDLITAVFHEMVHVRQSERGEKMDFTLDYLDRPFEIEAYKLQESMFKKYKYIHDTV